MKNEDIYGHITIKAIKPGESVIFAHKLYYVVKITVVVDIDGNVVQSVTCQEITDLPGMPDKLDFSTTCNDFSDDFPESYEDFWNSLPESEIPEEPAYVEINPDNYDYNILY